MAGPANGESLACKYCTRGEEWASPGIGFRGKALQCWKNGVPAETFTTTPAHGFTGYYQNVVLEENYELFDGPTSMGTCTVTTTFSHDGAAIIEVPPTTIEDIDDLCESSPYTPVFVDSTLNPTGEITDADLSSYLLSEIDNLAWMTADDLPAIILASGSGYSIGSASAAGRKLEYFASVHLDALGISDSAVCVGLPAFNGIDVLEFDNAANEVPKTYSCTWEPVPFEFQAGGPFTLNSGSWIPLPFNDVALWNVDLTAEMTAQRYNLNYICEVIPIGV